MLFDQIITVMLGIQGFAMLLCFFRVIIGPSMHDRIVALDSIIFLIIASTGAIMILHRTLAYTEIVIVISMLAFISSIAWMRS